MSTYSQTRAVGNPADDATFRVWGKFLSDSMQSAGWTKTADTGQVDWSSVARPSTINTVAGYEIRKSPTKTGFTDFYLKIEYGAGGNVAYTSIWFTIGTASNGSGTLTGTVSTRYQRAASTVTGACEDLVSGGEDWLALIWSASTAAPSTAPGMIVFDRFTDADGNYLTDGITAASYTNNAVTGFSMNSSSVFAATIDLPCGYMPYSYPGTAGTVNVAPAMRNLASADYPMQALCYIGVSNTGSGQTHSFAIFPGKTQTWRGNEVSIGSAVLQVITPEDVCPVIRWE